jgi:hypothetical protein
LEQATSKIFKKKMKGIEWKERKKERKKVD